MHDHDVAVTHRVMAEDSARGWSCRNSGRTLTVDRGTEIDGRPLSRRRTRASAWSSRRSTRSGTCRTSSHASPAGLPEVILVDGGSVDDTVEVARELRPDVVRRAADPRRQGQRPRLRLRRLHRRHHRDDRRRRVDRPRGDPSVRRRAVHRAPTSSRARASHRAAQPRHHPAARARQPGLNLLVNVLFGTGYTDLCYGYNAFWRALPAGTDLPRRRAAARRSALGRRLRDRDADQHPRRGRACTIHEVPSSRARPHPRRRATSTPSATAPASCAPSSPSSVATRVPSAARTAASSSICGTGATCTASPSPAASGPSPSGPDAAAAHDTS